MFKRAGSQGVLNGRVTVVRMPENALDLNRCRDYTLCAANLGKAWPREWPGESGLPHCLAA